MLSHREKLTTKKVSYPILVYLTSKDDGQSGCFAMNGAIGVVPEDFQGSIQTWQPEVRDIINLHFSVTKF